MALKHEVSPQGGDLMRPAAASQYVDTSERTLEQWRYLGRGPAYVKVGKAVRYRKADLDAWIARQTVRPEVA
jgi:hypothetical protein